jgi:hypothetical protein
MAYLLLAVAVLITLLGLAKVSRTAPTAHRIPWGQLLLWAVLFGGGLSIWLISARIH